MCLKKYCLILIQKCIAHDGVWAWISGTLVRLSMAFQYHRNVELSKRSFNSFVLPLISRICLDLRVRNGPFEGMIYPSTTSVGSTLFPKLLGSYERELHSLIEALCTRSYNLIIDIGCAEGYYAVGMAYRLKNAQVLAYDIEPDARDLCAKMATLNHVADRITIKPECPPSELISLNLPERCLIICDCEGYEVSLFTPEVVNKMANHDLLIEVHDCLDIETSAIIRQRFEATHDITVIQSVDDIQKPYHKNYAYPELASYNAASRHILLGECRPSIMEWFFMTPK
ncbi:hypothetical protein BH11VER1_BH11VER1_10790 [soil metagenome]